MHETNHPGEDLVQVWVPQGRLTEVYALLGSNPEVPPPGVEEPTTDASGWTESLLEQLAGSTFVTTRRVAAVLDHLADRPGEPTPTSDLLDATGLSESKLKSAWVKLPGHLKNHYSPDLGSPVHKGWGPLIKQDRSEMYYWVDEDLAHRWKAFRKTA